MRSVIESIEAIEFGYTIEDGAKPDSEYGALYNTVYEPDSRVQRRALCVRIHTADGPTGECVSTIPGVAIAHMDTVAEALIGKDPLKRERHWTEIKRKLKTTDQLGLGPIDIALWDYAGKAFGAPVHELLGSFRDRLPAQASTAHGQREGTGGLDSAEAFADFAETCREMGYPAFKIHGFDDGEEKAHYERDIEAIKAVADRVGDEMDLMIDSSCKYRTWGQALEVGKVLDECEFFWYEDPYNDGGTSQHGHRRLMEKLDTPLLQTEKVRGVESHTDFAANEATDFLRADPEYDGGITGAMKIARVAEGFGLDIEYHGSSPARRHCMAASRNSNYYEMALVHPDFKNPFDPPAFVDYFDDLDAIDSDGTVPVPDGPGLGVELDLEYVESNALRHRTYE